MDPLILSQKSKKWFEAVRNLKDHLNELDLSEQTAIDFLNDAWRTRTFDSDLTREAREMTQILIRNQKLHSANRKINEWTKEICGTSDLMYTRDAKTYEEVRGALRKTWQESRPKPAPKPDTTPKPNSGSSPKPAPKPTAIDPIILSQKAKKWVEGTQYLLDHADELDQDEGKALIFLLTEWQRGKYDTALIPRIRECIKTVRDSQRLHSNNRKINEWTKEICNTAELLYTRDAATFSQVAVALDKALKENPIVDHESNPKPDKSPAKIKVTGVKFNNYDINSKLVSETLPHNTQFVNPIISYTRVSGSGEVVLAYRIFDPNHRLLRGSGAPEGYTIGDSFNTNASGTVVLQGFGSSSGTYYRPGTYRFELFQNGQLLYSTDFTIPSPSRNNSGNSSGSNSGYRPNNNTSSSSKGGKKKRKKGDLIAGAIAWICILAIFGWVGYKCSGGGGGETMYSVGDVHLTDKKGKPITTIAGPTKVELLGIDDNKAHIKVDGKKGYVDAKYVMNAEESKRLEYVINQNPALETDFGRKAVQDFIANNPSIVNNPGNWRIFNTSETTVPKAVMHPKPANPDVQEVLAFVVASEKRYQRGVYHLMKNGEIVRVMNQQVPVGDLLTSLSYIPSTGKYDIKYAKDNKIVTPAKVKATADNPFLVNDISFVTVDGNTGKTISQKVTKQSLYVAPVISYTAKPDGRNKKFLVKVFDPSGKLVQGKESPEGGTYYSGVENWEIKQKGQLTLTGWRNNDTSMPWETSGYRMEIWDGDRMVGSGKVTVK